jgi:hypothetical protein
MKASFFQRMYRMNEGWMNESGVSDRVAHKEDVMKRWKLMLGKKKDLRSSLRL